jgi:uncharacterized protein
LQKHTILLRNWFQIKIKEFSMSAVCRNFKSLKSVAHSNRFTRGFSATAEDIKVYVLQYTYVEGMLEKRVPHRTSHLSFTESYIADKYLVAGGAFVPEVDQGMLLFKSKKSIVENFARNDPYVVNGLIREYKIREWSVAVGGV